MDIAEFLTTRYDEDEQGAREACDRDSGKWFVGRKWNVYREEDTAPHEDQDEHDLVVYGNMLSQSAHIARHDPARVLREIEAKRRVLERHSNDGEMHACIVKEYGAFETHWWRTTPCPTLRDLAEPYSDHADYSPAWALEHSA